VELLTPEHTASEPPSEQSKKIHVPLRFDGKARLTQFVVQVVWCVTAIVPDGLIQRSKHAWKGGNDEQQLAMPRQHPMHVHQGRPITADMLQDVDTGDGVDGFELQQVRRATITNTQPRHPVLGSGGVQAAKVCQHLVIHIAHDDGPTPLGSEEPWELSETAPNIQNMMPQAVL